MKIRRTYFLDELLIAKLKKLSYMTGKSKAYFVNLALDNLDYNYAISGNTKWKEDYKAFEEAKNDKR